MVVYKFKQITDYSAGIHNELTPIPSLLRTTLYTHLFFLSILQPFGTHQPYHKTYQSRP